jgi:hypothetical protein
MIGRLGDRRWHLRLGMAAGAGDVPTSPGEGGVHRTVQSINPASAPTDCRPVRIAAQLPATEHSVDRLPAAVPLRPIRPRTAGEDRSRMLSIAHRDSVRPGHGGAPAAGMPSTNSPW